MVEQNKDAPAVATEVEKTEQTEQKKHDVEYADDETKGKVSKVSESGGMLEGKWDLCLTAF